MGEGRIAEFMVLELPEVAEVQAHVEPDRPVIVFALDRALKRASLRMTLDARVVRVHIVETAGIDDRLSNRPRDMRAARPVATLATDIPLRRRFGRNVVVH